MFERKTLSADKIFIRRIRITQLQKYHYISLKDKTRLEITYRIGYTMQCFNERGNKDILFVAIGGIYNFDVNFSYQKIFNFRFYPL